MDVGRQRPHARQAVGAGAVVDDDDAGGGDLGPEPVDRVPEGQALVTVHDHEVDDAGGHARILVPRPPPAPDGVRGRAAT